MQISILGSGMVGQILATKIQAIGHNVHMGTRDPESTKQRTEKHQFTGQSFADWYRANPDIQLVAYEDLPEDSDLFINATHGGSSIDALKNVGAQKLHDKIIIDAANPLDFSQGFPPTLTVCNTDSLGEQIQGAFPGSKVVKTLNTMNAYVMVNPAMVPGEHNIFLSGNDAGAKAVVTDFLGGMGWPGSSVIDLGDISTARGTEMILPIWLQLMSSFGTPEFNFHIARKVS